MPVLRHGEQMSVENALTRLDSIVDRLEGVYSGLRPSLEGITGRKVAEMHGGRTKDENDAPDA